jgi:lipid-A-disaccharide synthase
MINVVKETALLNEPGIRSASLLVVAGDLSADKHTGKLLARLKQAAPELKVWGMGSTHMRDSGAELLFDCKDFSSMGIIGVIKLVPFLKQIGMTLLAEIDKRQPRAVLLVDYGGFNIELAKAIRKQFPKLPVLYFIAPQVWGSRPWRIKTLAKTISKMLVTFPFEEPLYQSYGIPVRFVGHPLSSAQVHKERTEIRQEFCSRHALNPEKPLIAVFSGSRKGEIRNLFPVVWQAMQWLSDVHPDVQFALSQANPERASDMQMIIEQKAHKRQTRAQYVTISASENDDLMSAADIVWAKSGTTALEATLHGTPMIVFYRADWLSYWIFLAFKRVQKISLPNLLSGKNLVPELIQLDCRADQLVKYTRDLLAVPELREEIRRELLALRDKLGEGEFTSACTEEILAAIQ